MPSAGTIATSEIFTALMRLRTTCGAPKPSTEDPMFRTLMIGAVSALTLSAAAFAQQGGTAQEARAMLDKAVAAVKADQAVALAMFLKGEGGFLDRELYPFLFRIADGKT